jgi:Chaperone of endosialidase
MSFLSGANNAAQQQSLAALMAIAAAQQGAGTANNQITTATQNAVAPSNAILPQAMQGLGAYGNLLGLGGPAGNQSALATLSTMPGYQFTLGQGNNAINAAAAANGTLNSGNQLTALQNYGQGLAQGNYGNYVSQLAPYLGLASGTAGNIGNIYSTEGAQQAGVTENATNAIIQALSGIGNANASASLANTARDTSLLGGGLNLLGSGGTGGFMNSALGQGISGLGSGIASIFSDERLKDDIEPVGELYDGQQIYSYKYKDDPFRTHIGLMAQDVENLIPDAVSEIGGFKAVDYGKATSYAAELGGFLEAA